MSQRWAREVHALLLRAYPPAFRAAFADEMQAVFADAVREHGVLGPLLRELRDWPGSVGRAWLNWEVTMETHPRPVSWAQSALAGLPHLLYALAKYLPLGTWLFLGTQLQAPLSRLLLQIKRWPLVWPLLTVNLPDTYWNAPRLFYLLNEVAFALLIIVLLIVGGRRSWPRWSATAIGYGLVVLFEITIAYFPDRPWALPLAAGWLALVMLVFVMLARRDALSGLLAALPIAPMFIATITLDGVRGAWPEAFLFIGMGLVLTAAVSVAMRQGHWPTALTLLGLAVLLTDAPIAFAAVYYNNMPHSPTPTPLAVLMNTLGSWLGLAIFTLPVWAVLAWRRARPA